MLFRSTETTVPATFKRIFISVKHEHGTRGLRRPCNHISYEVSMTGGIEHSKISVLCFKEAGGQFNGDTTFTLLVQLIHNIRKLKAGLIIHVTKLIHFADFLL